MNELGGVAAIDWPGIGAALTGASVFLVAMGGVVGMFRNTRTIKRLDTRTEETHAVVQTVKHDTGQIDAAVNGKSPGEQSISAEVHDLHGEIPPAKTTNGHAILPMLERIEVELADLKKQLAQ